MIIHVTLLPREHYRRQTEKRHFFLLVNSAAGATHRRGPLFGKERVNKNAASRVP